MAVVHGDTPVTTARSKEPQADVDGEDALLLGRVRARDQAAFRSLADRHMPALLNLARRLLRDPADAEDVAQEAFLRLWTSSPTLEPGPGGLRPWLRRVATNIAIDRLRVRGRLELKDELPEVAEPAGQLTALQETDLTARVGEALGQLAERQRIALTLFHYEGLSMNEIASIMGLSEGAVESLLARARRTLKGILHDEWRSLIPDRELEW